MSPSCTNGAKCELNERFRDHVQAAERRSGNLHPASSVEQHTNHKALRFALILDSGVYTHNEDKAPLNPMVFN